MPYPFDPRIGGADRTIEGQTPVMQSVSFK